MDLREKLIEMLKEAETKVTETLSVAMELDEWIGIYADHLIEKGVTVQECARPIDEWEEDYGDVLWWKFPIGEPPYVGSPLDAKWPGYHTHWTHIPMPEPPKGE